MITVVHGEGLDCGFLKGCRIVWKLGYIVLIKLLWDLTEASAATIFPAKTHVSVEDPWALDTAAGGVDNRKIDMSIDDASNYWVWLFPLAN